VGLKCYRPFINSSIWYQLACVMQHIGLAHVKKHLQWLSTAFFCLPLGLILTTGPHGRWMNVSGLTFLVVCAEYAELCDIIDKCRQRPSKDIGRL